MKLSVVVTTYNRALKLAQTLDSLSKQSRQPDEVIISDDCSSDNTRDVALSWQQRFRRFVYSRNEQNLYMPGNLNAAVSLASGAYIANLHDADVFAPDLLAKWETALDVNPNAGFVFCGGKAVFCGDQPERYFLHDISPCTNGRKFFDSYFVGNWGSPVWGTVMARRKAYKRLGKFDAYYGFVSDVDMWMRMCGVYDVAYVREPLLILDNEMKIERRFSWKKLIVENDMVVTNIKRIFSNEPGWQEMAMKRQKRAIRLRFMRLLMGRLRHLDLGAVQQGAKLYWKIFVTNAMPEVWIGKAHPEISVPWN